MNDTAKGAAESDVHHSGRFLLRLDPALHARIRGVSEALGLSLNEYCNRILAAPGSGALLPAMELVQRTHAQFGDALIGMVAHGSWARGDLTDSSDIDLLVPVSDEVRIGRDLYRPWDAHPLAWDSREVELHFVHLPAEEGPVSGTWAEAALEGIVLLDSKLRISRLLGEIRRRIADGEIVRHLVNGQPYWVRAA